jgi:rhodanese-related sulfurtransferase
MTKSVKTMLADANASVTKLTPQDAAAQIRAGQVLVVDVRDPSELAQSGKVKGAVNVPRGMLEFRADADSPYHDPAFDKGKTILVHCASGGRSALAAKTLQEMGYTSVFNAGGFKELAEAGVEIDKG